ncbi:hypothetical protein [Facklamia sp. 7083-14-GEN3]|uniref:hypothetical protein n=1 Tax=Facklamia sp. 7083-14-GEN3 TaxID=2973478 RepID=UPI00215C1565|nr:hypothetical protein [Facklamia sp. 7083-14-GEN3]MCR8968672.1 hypothetical protein [Facklamia sp. 7083-14-GEN3]
MPNNSENFYRKAMNALEQNDYERATIFLKESYQIEPSPKVFKELISIHIIQNKSQAVKKLWQGFLSEQSIQDLDHELALLYVQSLPYLFSHQELLIQLYEIKEYFGRRNWDVSLIAKQIENIKEAEALSKELQLLIDTDELDIKVKQLKELTLFELLKEIKTLYNLDYSLKHPVLTALLSDKEISQFVKSDILHHYVFHNYQVHLKLAWFEKIEKIDSQSLVSYKQDSTYLYIKALLESYTDNNNPHIYDRLLEEINLLMMVYYPFIEEKISDPIAWFNGFLSYYHIEEFEKNETNNQMDKTLRQAIDEIKQFSL